MSLRLPENAVFVSALVPAADAGGRSSSYFSLKSAVKAWIVCYIDQGNAATITLTPQQATAVAGTGAKVISATPIWTNQDAAAAVTLTAQTAAANFTTSAAVKNKVVVFEIDAARCMDVAGGFDCINIATGASNAANITSAFILMAPKYPSATPVSPLVD